MKQQAPYWYYCWYYCSGYGLQTQILKRIDKEEVTQGKIKINKQTQLPQIPSWLCVKIREN